MEDRNGFPQVKRSLAQLDRSAMRAAKQALEANNGHLSRAAADFVGVLERAEVPADVYSYVVREGALALLRRLSTKPEFAPAKIARTLADTDEPLDQSLFPNSSLGLAKLDGVRAALEKLRAANGPPHHVAYLSKIAATLARVPQMQVRRAIPASKLASFWNEARAEAVKGHEQ